MPQLTRRQVTLIVAAVVAVLAIAVGIYGLVTGPSDDHADQQPSLTVNKTRAPRVGAAESDPSRRALPQTDDPVALARAVAEALFDWDTTSGYLPSDYEAAVLADADPSGEETSGLITDVATYLPTTEQWLDLATMNVAQSIVIASATIPPDWQTVVAESHGELRPGSTAVTIAGIRDRSGVWNGEPASTSSPVSFTVFVACRPAFDRCHVLRLSQLDNPLR